MAGLTASADGFMSPTPAPSGVSYYHPYLRGFGLTRFLSQETLLDGRGVALAHDAIDLATFRRKIVFARADGALDGKSGRSWSIDF